MMRQEIKPQFMLIREGPYMHDDQTYLVLEPKNIIGRGEVATLSILSLYVSRNQCELLYDNQQCKWYVKDNNSLNGTFINETKIEPNIFHELNIDDRLGLGISWQNFRESIETSEQLPDPDYYVYRFAFSYPFNGAAINSLCLDVAGL